MIRLVVASLNPVKLEAARRGYKRLFPSQESEWISCDGASGVSAQPMSSAETLQGALNRAEDVKRKLPDADFWIGIEGGVEPVENDLHAFAWVVVLSNHKVGKGRSGTFILPPRVSELIRSGLELGEADDIVFGRTNSKQENGAIGLLTGNVIDRTALYEHAVILAFAPFMNPDLY